jgi:hypothetical protein
LQNAWDDAVLDGEDLVMNRPDKLAIGQPNRRASDVPSPTRESSHFPNSEISQAAGPSYLPNQGIDHFKPQPPPKPVRPPTLNFLPRTEQSKTGPALQTKDLKVPTGQNQSPTHFTGQGHITVNLSPVSSPTRTQIAGSRGTVTSSLNFPSPSSLPKSPARSPQCPPSKFGWAEHIYGSKKKVKVSPGDFGSNRVPSLPQDNFPASPLQPPRGADCLNNVLPNTQIPIGFERLLIDSSSGTETQSTIRSRNIDKNVPVVSVSSVSRKPIFKRHSTDMQNLIRMAPEQSENASVGGVKPTNATGFGTNGPSSMGAKMNDTAAGDSSSEKKSSSANRNFLLQFLLCCFRFFENHKKYLANHQISVYVKVANYFMEISF